MKTGLVFDIKEFAVHDGPGIRMTIFMKGCPLRCAWCHNPEGLSSVPQKMRSPAGTRVAGLRYTSGELAAIVNEQSGILRANDGGVTFSGGEPLCQAAYVAEVIDRLDGVHVLLDTSGDAAEDDFRTVVSRADLVHYDLKLVDPEAHRRWTGIDNARILANLQVLETLGTLCVVRVPLIPGVTDTNGNLTAIANTVAPLDNVLRVELLPYNRAAGGKYTALGLAYRPEFNEGAEVNANTGPFESGGLEVIVRC